MEGRSPPAWVKNEGSYHVDNVECCVALAKVNRPRGISDPLRLVVKTCDQVAPSGMLTSWNTVCI